MALVYLVNKPQVLGIITRWLLFLKKYNFTLVYNACRTHVVTDALSRLTDTTKPTSVSDQTIDANQFYTKLEWLNDVNYFVIT
jgi:hypothetical protein